MQFDKVKRYFICNVGSVNFPKFSIYCEYESGYTQYPFAEKDERIKSDGEDFSLTYFCSYEDAKRECDLLNKTIKEK